VLLESFISTHDSIGRSRGAASIVRLKTILGRSLAARRLISLCSRKLTPDWTPQS